MSKTMVTAKCDDKHAIPHLHTLSRWEYGPNPSPACIKAESYLRLNKIHHSFQPGSKTGPRESWPYLDHKGVFYADSDSLIEYCNQTFGVDMDAPIKSGDNAEEKQHYALMITRLCEQSIYFYLCRYRWETKENFKTMKASMDFGSAPGFVKNLVTGKIRDKMIEQLNMQGAGDKTLEGFHAEWLKDMKTLEFLMAYSFKNFGTGNSETSFLFGDKPTTVDCMLFGMLHNCEIFPGTLDAKGPGPAHDFTKKSAVFQPYLKMMMQLVYPDVEELKKMTGGEKGAMEWKP